MPDSTSTWPDIKAVIFDLDGTLLDTLEDLADAANLTLEQHGLPTHPRDAFRLFVGRGVDILMRRALPESERGDTGPYVRTFREIYGRRWNNRTRPYPGVEKLLRELAARKIGLAVCTNKPETFALQCVETFLPGHPFAAVIGAAPGRPNKPSPHGALEAAQALGVPPERCVFLGDSGVDMATGTAAAMFPVGVLWGFRDAQELLDNGAQALLKRPADLLNFIEDPS